MSDSENCSTHLWTGRLASEVKNMEILKETIGGVQVGTLVIGMAIVLGIVWLWSRWDERKARKRRAKRAEYQASTQDDVRVRARVMEETKKALLETRLPATRTCTLAPKCNCDSRNCHPVFTAPLSKRRYGSAATALRLCCTQLTPRRVGTRMRHGTWSVRHWSASTLNLHRDPCLEPTAAVSVRPASGTPRWPRRLRGLEVEHELKFGGLHDRQVGGLLALENPSGIDASLAIAHRLSVPWLIRPPAATDSRKA
jgi:hypothetical protein